MEPYRGKHNHPLRRLGERLLDTVLFGGLVAKWSYRCGLHGRLHVTRHEVALPEDKQLPRPLTIAFASDFHAGPTTHPAIFSDLFDHIEAAQPDILLLGGDYVSCKSSYVTALAQRLSQCNPPAGKYAVFGNHDLWTDDRHLRQVLGAASVEVLVNQNATLPFPFESVSIGGLDDPWTGRADASTAFQGAAEIRILLMHAPDGLYLLEGEKFDVGFAGHTHGGQIALADGTPIVVPHGPLCRTYCHGKFQIEDNGSLIVSRGIGCSTLPVRINADPELVICTLR
jgi:hypothetical protein